MIPDLSTVFETINQYRYSITVGIALLYFVPMFFPVGWQAASATWQYAAAIMFFLSVGMILTRDVWPSVKQLFGFGVNKKKVSIKILKACKEKDENPPFEVKFPEVDAEEEKVKELVDDFLSHDECRISDSNTLIVTEKGLKKLKGNI